MTNQTKSAPAPAPASDDPAHTAEHTERGACCFPALRAVWRRIPFPGLTRWALRPHRTNSGWRVYVHHFDGTDVDMHNHPWTWAVSLVLRGEYRETCCDGDPTTTPQRERVVRAGCVNWIPRRRHHRITDIPSRDRGGCWTLFIAGPAVRDAGGAP